MMIGTPFVSLATSALDSFLRTSNIVGESLPTLIEPALVWWMESLDFSVISVVGK